MEDEKVTQLETEFDRLDAKRQTFFSEIQELVDLSKKSFDDKSRKEFLIRVSTLDANIQKVEELTDQMVQIQSRLKPKSKPNYQTVKTVLSLRHQIMMVREELKGEAPPLENQPPPTREQFKLPEINLPEFAGELAEWPLFYKKFNDIVDSNPNLDNMAKLHYLLGCLRGKAREMCAAIAPTPANYQVILNVLKNQFNNERRLADLYHDKMVELKPLVQESATELSELMLKFDAARQSLIELKLPDLADYYDASRILKKLDPQTRRAFETSAHSKIPTYAEIRDFVFSHVDALQQLPKVRQNSAPRFLYQRSETPLKTTKNFVTQFPSSLADSDGKKPVVSCSLCSDSHSLFKCDKFIALKHADRLNFVTENDLCFNCLSSHHRFQDCQSINTCRYCKDKHHSLLHGVAEEPGVNFSQLCIANQPKNSAGHTTLLSTSVVLIQTPKGPQKARFLIDSASQSHFITADCCNRIGLEFRNVRSSVLGIGTVTTSTLGKTQFAFSSRFNPSPTWKIHALVVEKITNHLPSALVRIDQFSHLHQLQLADEQYFVPGMVDGILGSEIFGLILGSSTIHGPPNAPVAVQTKLGYVIIGTAPVSQTPGCHEPAPTDSQVCCSFEESKLTSALQKFWELEEVPDCAPLSEEDKRCEEFFAATTLRDASGRYCVHLPFREWPPSLGESWTSAARRFWSLEHRLQRFPKLRQQYADVIQDYLDQGHLTEVSTSAIKDSDLSVFIPHFPVLKESSSTPLRIVFDASAKTSNGRSLNNALFPGPKLQNNLFQILIAFRMSRIAVTSDIKQMYRNINVTPPHRRYQRILWRDSPLEPLKTYELNSVVFGVTSAPYLALRTVQQLAADEAHRFPLASALVQKGMYVDDLVISLDSPREAITAFHELTNMFKAGGFRLTKWSTNSPELTPEIPSEDTLLAPVSFEDSSSPNESTRILGLNWTATSDDFFFEVNFPQSVFTKRGILSTIARIWDPLGFLAPVSLFAKILVKELWMNQIGWDDEIPATICHRWKAFHAELGSLQDLQIPRHFGHIPGGETVLVGFCDSSERGYGAVIYTIVRSQNQSPNIQLLCAKSKVTPVKTCSLPRLELCAALLLSKLMQICVSSLQSRVNLRATYACTDSSATLHWIKQEPYRWKTFIANRVAKIQALTPDTKWVHIRSEQNIADCVSRGQTPSQLLENHQWTQGPNWLRLSMTEWPITPLSSGLPSEVATERKTFVATVFEDRDAAELETLLQRFSSWTRLLNVTVYLLRFAGKLPRRPAITLQDLGRAEHLLIRRVQRIFYAEEFRLLEKSQSSSVKLRPLAPFVDNDILRVGGRISRSDLGLCGKHPILIPKVSHLATLIIDHTHNVNLHTGPNLVLSLIRQKYWIPGSRNLIRKRIRSCNICFKAKPRPVYPPMADLPSARVLQAKPFLHAGVDYAGPFSISISRRRGVRCQKSYLCLFVCLCTKAVHLELASDLTTDTFLSCFKRFISRRGPVSCLYSDRGTNFIGAKTELGNLYRLLESNEFTQRVQGYLQPRNVDWVFNPPQSPHFGGIWEGNIKSVKSHLPKIIGRQILSYEELYTVLTQIEALLNSRPLCALSSDPAETEALTPAHFLTLMPLQGIPLTPLDPTKTARTRKELLDDIIRGFWKRWHLEYLSSLQTRKKWNTPTEPLTVGTVVLIKEDNAAPLYWPLGRVVEVFPGTDGVVRVAAVQVKKSVYRRPVVKLCPLPTQ